MTFLIYVHLLFSEKMQPETQPATLVRENATQEGIHFKAFQKLWTFLLKDHEIQVCVSPSVMYYMCWVNISTI